MLVCENSAAAVPGFRVSPLGPGLSEIEPLLEESAAIKPEEERREKLLHVCNIATDTALDLVAELPEGAGDAEARNLLLFIRQLRHAVAASDVAGTRLAALSVQDVLRRMSLRLERELVEDAGVALRVVGELLSKASAQEMATILGVSAKTLAAWRDGAEIRSSNAKRLVLVARCLLLLRATMTPTGLLMWFQAPVAQLDGRSPVEEMERDMNDAWTRLQDFAAGGRAR
ncbi:MAG: hypothetical protein Q4E05_03065 [Pseudoclavibacter sp.]|nr:hypothetical protein [Pseudoclavibacter sp.]